MVENKKKDGYILETGVCALSSQMIDDLKSGNRRTTDGMRHSENFVFARGAKNSKNEVSVSIVEVVGQDELPHYNVLIIDYVNGEDGSDKIFSTNALTEEDLANCLLKIWNGLIATDLELPVSSPSTATKIDGDAELAYLKSYISGCCLDDETSVTFLYSLWIAYSLHQNLNVDSPEYEDTLMELWTALLESDDGEASHWENFDSFMSDMSRDLR